MEFLIIKDNASNIKNNYSKECINMTLGPFCSIFSGFIHLNLLP